MEDGGAFGGGPGGGFGGGLGPGMGSAQLQSLAGALGLGGMQGQDARDPRGMRVGGRDSRDVRTQMGRDATRDGGGEKLETIDIRGEGRLAGPNTTPEPATVSIDSAGLTLQIGSARPIRAGYRDLSLIAIQQSTVLLVLGEGSEGMRFMLEKFGDRLGPMVRLLRELRLKQRLTDGLVEVPDEPAELVEFAWTPTTGSLGPGPDGPAAPAAGVGQLVVQPWGFVVCPLDERVTWIHFRRASISSVNLPSPGEVAVDGAPGLLTLRGLGPAATRLHDRLEKLRDGAFADAAGFVAQLMPDAPFGVRQKASDLLVDGRPTRPDAFGDAGWPNVETAVLGEPTFAGSYESLCSTAGPAAPRWVAMSPEAPGGTVPKIWFLIALPGNLVAMELVTAGAHATYFYRAMPRSQYKGEPPDKLGIAAERAVRDISEALVDCRFLREPMALPIDQLRLPKYLRYRLALEVLPSLVWARGRFVARIVHRDPTSWSAAVADLVRWHATARDEAAEWPGRGAQESQIGAAGGDDGEAGDAGTSDFGGAGEAAGGDSADSAAAVPDESSTRQSRPSGTLG
ncbi:MAG TPA: hypothetical protein VFC12_09120 [Terriglobales bacterium]|nr:hypothetical protein [Terriglobales bacterium]